MALPDDFLDTYVPGQPAKASKEVPVPKAAPTPNKGGGLPDDFLDTYQPGGAQLSADPENITGDTPWSDVLKSGAEHYIPDIGYTALDIGKGIYNTVTDPKGTAEGIYNLGKGTYDYYEGNDTPESKGVQEVGNKLYHDYFTKEGWKQAIAEHPFSRSLDIGMLMTAPEAAAGKMGLEGTAKALSMANPTTWAEYTAGKAVDLPSKLLNTAVGEFGTHTGGLSQNLIREGAKAGYGPDIRKGLSSRATLDDMVGGFEQSMEDEKNLGQTLYQSDQSALASDQQRLSFDPIDQAMRDARSKFISDTEVSPDPNIINTFGKLQDLINAQKTQANLFDNDQAMARNRMEPGGLEWPAGQQPPGPEDLPDRSVQPGSRWQPGYIENLNDPNSPALNTLPNRFLTPLAMDELKQAMGRIVDDAPDGSKAKKLASQVYQATADQIKEKAPIYDGMMQRYNQMWENRRAYQRELGLNKNNPDAALKKLFTGVRPNAASTFGRRTDLMSQLAQNPKAAKALYTMAGKYNSAWFPRGFMGQFKMGTAPLWAPWAAPFLLHHPIALAGLAGQSPRIMGELNLLQGRIERQLGRLPWRQMMAPLATYGSASPYDHNLHMGWATNLPYLQDNLPQDVSNQGQQ